MAEAQSEDIADWRASTTQLREVVKWIATAFAALGAALIGTTPLSPLASSDNSTDQLVVLCICVAVALLSVGFIVWRCTSMLVPQTTTLPTLTTDVDYVALRQAIQDDPSAFLGAWSATLPSFIELRDDEYVILGGLDDALSTCDASQASALTAARDKVVSRIEAMGHVSRRLLAVAEYYRLRRSLNRDRVPLFAAAGATAIAIATFVVFGASAAEGHNKQVIEKTGGVVLFIGDSTTNHRRLVGSKCPSPFDAIVSRNNDGSWEISPVTPGCRRGVITVAADEVSVLVIPSSP